MGKGDAGEAAVAAPAAATGERKSAKQREAAPVCRGNESTVDKVN